MGISGLYTELQPYLQHKHLLQFEGLVFGIDGYCLLHQAGLMCSRQLCTKVPTRRFVKTFMDRLHMYDRFKVIPLVVFDGCRVPAKDDENTKRERDRQANLKIGHHYDKIGNHDDASKAYRKAFSKSEIVFEVIQELRAERIEFIVSPYEGDAQLALLMKQGRINVAVSDDTDLIPYGCSHVIFSTDKDGYVLYFNRLVLDNYEKVKIEHEKLNKGIADKLNEDIVDDSKKKVVKSRGLIDLSGLNDDQLILFCVMRGCDYVGAVGLDDFKLRNIALALSSDFDAAMAKLKDKHNGKEIDDKRLRNAFMTYKHHLVFDQVSKKVVYLNQPKEGVDLSFLGHVMEEKIAIGIAEGKLDPKNDELRPYEATKELTLLKMDEEIQVELPNEWKFWTKRQGINPSERDSFKTFDGFRSLYKLNLTNKLEDGDELHCFREGYSVTDAHGCWTQRLRSLEVEKSWQLNCLSLIEGKIHPQQLVLGTILTKAGKWVEMSIWTKEATNDEQLTVAKDWKFYTNHEFVIGYASRQDGGTNNVKLIPNEQQYRLMT